ncbi:hypothetical protein ACJ4V0_15735 [Phreatobacter sp. HK31-P]
MTTISAFETARNKLIAEHEAALRDLDMMHAAAFAAETLAACWRAGDPSRVTRVYVFGRGVHLGLGLGKGESFGDAEEAFAEAQDALTAALAGGPAEWNEVKDESTAYEAVRTSRAFVDDAYLSVAVFAVPSTGTACSLVKVGTRQETRRTEQKVEVPVYRSVCPGDPVPLGAQVAA